MIKHIALFNLKPEHAGVGKAENARRILANVAGLRKAIPCIRHIEAAGPFVDPQASFPQSDVVVYVEFASREDYKTYFNHPKHREAAAFAASVSDKIAGITYEV